MKTHEEKVKELLEEKGIQYRVFEHPKFSSTEEAMSYVPGVNAENALKSILFKGDEKFILVVLPVSLKIDKEKIKNIFDISGKLSLASSEDSLRVTHCEIGTVSPFAQFYEQVSVILDTSVRGIDKIFITPGVFTKTYTLSAYDLIQLIKPQIEHISL